MPLSTTGPGTRRIAVIGGGISGLAAAHLLSRGHAVVLYEAERRLGGHARTVVAGKRGDQPVDTGFIVFNHVNYPHLTRLFRDLDVPVAKSDMSFAASIDGGRFEYALRDLNGLLAQRSNVLRPAYWGMLRDILRFNREAPGIAATDLTMTIGTLLAQLGTGAWFRDRYILPFSGAIWSTPTAGILDFPADAMLRFFANHALLSYSGQHQWWTVRGGSVEYVRRLESALLRAGVDLRPGSPVAGVRRHAAGVQVRAHGGDWEAFDDVVLATHADDSLALLEDPAPEERSALAAVRYQPNEAVLHADAAMMPRRRAAWSSWNYCEGRGERPDRIALTYWMNSLQPIPKDDPLFVTLNPTRAIRDDLVHDVTTFRHPVYDVGTLAAQAAVRGFNGARNTWFCGAWMKNGFHEDGFASAVDVVEAMAAQAARIAA
ncbi:MAG: NAD(P)/FAD-dependent oxidoreductase [Gemmobacter sp.]